MAITVSVGFVVDDAIVVIENVFRHIETGEPPLAGGPQGRPADRVHGDLDEHLARGGLHPADLHDGLIGRLLHEFAVTLSLAILVSGVVSLTFTPMMCARFLEARVGVRTGRTGFSL